MGNVSARRSGSKPVKSAAKPRKPRHYLPAEQRRALIISAAQRVFSRSGLKGARTRELAEEAGINQATLFEHFPSKEALYQEAMLEPLGQLIDGARERALSYAKADSAESRQPLVQSAVRQQMASMDGVFPLLVQALFSDQAKGQALFREQIEPMLKAQAELMKPFTKDSLDPELVQLASFGMFFAVSMHRQFSESAWDQKNLSRQLTELITQGSALPGKPAGKKS